MALICPSCRKVLLKPQVDRETKLEIDACPKCYGMWFDPNELGKFFQSEKLKKKFFLPEDVAPKQSVGYTISTRARVCPRCKKGMKEKLFGDVSVDVCEECQGIWLDEGELRLIVEQYRKGKGGEKIVAAELSKGLKGKAEKPSLSEVVDVVLKFFGAR